MYPIFSGVPVALLSVPSTASIADDDALWTAEDVALARLPEAPPGVIALLLHAAPRLRTTAATARVGTTFRPRGVWPGRSPSWTILPIISGPPLCGVKP